MIKQEFEIYKSQHTALRALKALWGCRDLNETLRRVLRWAFRLNSENKQLRAKLVVSEQRIRELEARLEEVRGRNRALEEWHRSAEAIQYIIEGFQEFKVDMLNWPKPLAQAEIAPLPAYLEFIRSGSPNNWTVELDGEEFEGMHLVEDDEN